MDLSELRARVIARPLEEVQAELGETLMAGIILEELRPPWPCRGLGPNRVVDLRQTTDGQYVLLFARASYERGE
ncbi:MAG: hypothetical protein AB1331_02140 [Bacillota bacterium]